MNLQEFAALKPGDKVENHFAHTRAEVVEATDSGVRVKWSETSPSFFYSVQGTAWMHWSKVDETPKTA